MASVPALVDRAPATEQMAADVLAGLARRPKQLPSRYLYDRRGAELFERICELDEYYLTRTEMGILERAMGEIAERVGPRALVFEPGSGASLKTRLLLRGLESPAAFVPVDIAREQLAASARALAREFPRMEIRPVCADFLSAFELPVVARRVDRRVAFFPGSTIGNLTRSEAVRLLRRLRRLCGKGGMVLLGADHQKDAAVLRAAYDDAQGVSAAFAMNYLVRLNRELAATFDLRRFRYEAVYNGRLGRIEMSLVSAGRQTVVVAGRRIELRKGERLRTEVSYKYTPESVERLGAAARLRIERSWSDSRGYFGVYLLRPEAPR